MRGHWGRSAPGRFGSCQFQNPTAIGFLGKQLAIHARLEAGILFPGRFYKADISLIRPDLSCANDTAVSRA
jgi:hypothetical protein